MKALVSKMLLILSVVSMLGCGKRLANGDGDVAALTISPEEAAAEAAVQAISSIADDQENSSYAAFRSGRRSGYESVASIFFPQAKATADCQRVVTASCVSGVRSMTYSTCDVPLTSHTLDGNLGLAYSSTTCSMAAAGESVAATYDLTVAGPRGGSIRSFTSSRSSSIDGTVVGGGSALARTATGWEASIAGKHVVGRIPNGRTLFDLSLKTTSPIVITGTLSRANRVLNGGSLEVHHNIAGIKAVYTPNDVRYQNTCCHPVSGSWSVVYSGKKTGAASLTFAGCGNATLSQDGVETPVQLSYCQ